MEKLASRKFWLAFGVIGVLAVCIFMDKVSFEAGIGYIFGVLGQYSGFNMAEKKLNGGTQ